MKATTIADVTPCTRRVAGSSMACSSNALTTATGKSSAMLFRASSVGGGARPLPTGRQRYNRSFNGYQLRCDFGGWFEPEGVVAAVAEETRGHLGKITTSDVMNCVATNPKARFELMCAFVRNTEWRPRWDRNKKQVVVPSEAFNGDPQKAFLHGRVVGIRATSGWGYPFVCPERAMLAIRPEEGEIEKFA